MNYIIPIVVFAILGILAGVLLTVASKVFAVEVDERIEKISEALPQANCGACGYAGCADYANAIVNDNAPTNLCKPGGADVVKTVSDIMGTSAEVKEREVAMLHCNGNCNATSKKFDFSGVETCSAVKRFYGGDGLCAYGCIGLGDCIKVCEENAIKIKDGIADIDKSSCLSCGKCAKVCPNGLISLKPISKLIEVKCSSKDNGKITKQSCKNGCIGCKICEKKCQYDAIHVVDFHAVIDYDKCTSCGECKNACPVGAIINCSE